MLVFIELHKNIGIYSVALPDRLLKSENEDDMKVIGFGEEKSLVDVFGLDLVIESGAVELDISIVDVDCVLAPGHLQRDVEDGDQTVSGNVLEFRLLDDHLVHLLSLRHLLLHRTLAVLLAHLLTLLFGHVQSQAAHLVLRVVVVHSQFDVDVVLVYHTAVHHLAQVHAQDLLLSIIDIQSTIVYLQLSHVYSLQTLHICLFHLLLSKYTLLFILYSLQLKSSLTNYTILYYTILYYK